MSEGEAEHGGWLHYLIYILFGRRKGQQKKVLREEALDVFRRKHL